MPFLDTSRGFIECEKDSSCREPSMAVVLEVHICQLVDGKSDLKCVQDFMDAW